MMNQKILKQLTRLGAKFDAKKKLPSTIDTHVGKKDLAKSLAEFLYAVKWPRDTKYCAGEAEFPRGVEFATVEFDDEGDWYDGTPVVHIADDATGFQFLIAIENAADPFVYRVDHAGPYELGDYEGKLSEWLASLISEKMDTGVPVSNQPLALAISQALGGKKVDKKKLASLKQLKIKAHDIPSLDGLEQCTSLQVLQLLGYRYGNLDAIAKLKTLRTLWLPTDTLSVAVVAELTELKELRIGKAVDLSPLAKLTELTTISSGGEITSLEPIADLPKLKEVEVMASKLDAKDPVVTRLRKRGVHLKICYSDE
jgi:hypothetical protein